MCVSGVASTPALSCLEACIQLGLLHSGISWGGTDRAAKSVMDKVEINVFLLLQSETNKPCTTEELAGAMALGRPDDLSAGIAGKAVTVESTMERLEPVTKRVAPVAPGQIKRATLELQRLSASIRIDCWCIQC